MRIAALICVLAWLLAGAGLAAGAGGGELPRLAVVAPNQALVGEVQRVLREVGPRLEALTGAAPERIKVVVAGTRAEFERRMESLGGPRWAAGVALPGRGLIVVRSPSQLTEPDDFRFLLVHELVHLYLAAGLGSHPAPRWLAEGLAMYASEEGGWGLVGAMTKGVLSGGLIPFAELARGFPAQGDRAALAYAQSYYFIGYLLGLGGKKAVARLVKELSRGRDLTTALYLVTGHGLAANQRLFKEQMTSRFSWLALGAAGGTLWAVISLGAGVLLFWRRRVQVKRRLELDAEDDESEAGSESRAWPPPPPRGDVLGEAGLKGPDDRSPPGRSGG